MKPKGETRAYALLDQVVRQYRAILGDTLTGIYAHGSLAFGCFRWEAGDLDFLVVVQSSLTLDEKMALIRVLLALGPQAPPKGFEMSVVLDGDCLFFRYPTPFLLHFSNSHLARCQAGLAAYCAQMHGDDPDLAAHFTVVRSVGRALYGKPISAVFGDVPREAYLQSILADVAGAERKIDQNPVSVALNLCRVLAYAQEGLVLSKAQGGRWAVERLPQEHACIASAALADYEGGTPLAADGAALEAFARFLLSRIRALI